MAAAAKEGDRSEGEASPGIRWSTHLPAQAAAWAISGGGGGGGVSVPGNLHPQSSLRRRAQGRGAKAQRRVAQLSPAPSPAAARAVLRPPAAGRQTHSAPPPRGSPRRVLTGRTGWWHHYQQAAGSRGPEPYGGERRPAVCEAHACRWAVASPLLASPLLTSVCRAPSWPRRSKPHPREAWRALPTRQVEPAAGLGRRGAWRQPGVEAGGLRRTCRGGRARPHAGRAARSDPPSFSISIRFEFKTSRKPMRKPSKT